MPAGMTAPQCRRQEATGIREQAMAKRSRPQIGQSDDIGVRFLLFVSEEEFGFPECTNFRDRRLYTKCCLLPEGFGPMPATE
jgi:hypothetical protein